MAAPPDLRWQLTEGDDSQAALFDDIIERHVGKGEYRGLEFLHVNARRIINEVPAASRMPFRFTINAYRGCSHACAYCLGPDTPILLAEGRMRRITDLRVGDSVVGTERVGRHRRFVATPVLAHWSTVRPAYRVTLEDGTEIVASGDHRFLTERGWKHVTGTEHGTFRRPHLTTSNSLLGIGSMTTEPPKGQEYERGYVCGMGRGEPTIGHYAYERWGQPHPGHSFRLALTDLEPRARTRRYLQNESVDTSTFLFAAAAGARQAVHAIRTQARASAEAVANVRLLGGLGEVVRFILTVDPATTRKRTILGRALKGNGRRRVAKIEPLGLEMPMFDITTGTGDFIADGVISHNCFARPTHEFLGMDTGRDFDTKIVVKVNAVERLRAELAPARWARHHIAMGTNTDPYQRCEGKYRLTQGIVRELVAARNPFSILTKSTLILRDVHLLAEAAQVTDVRANFSIGTLDEEVWKLTEPGTPHPRQRVEAVAKLVAAGVPCGVLVAPVLPGLSDRADQLEAVVKACVEAGAVSVTPLLLHLRPGVREHYLGWLAGARPHLLAEHERLYPRAYASKARQQDLSRHVAALVARFGGRSASPMGTRSVSRSPDAGPAPASARQLTLEI